MAAIELGVSNGRVEGLNTKIRSIIARCYGLHSAQATLALVMLSCGPIDLAQTSIREGELIHMKVNRAKGMTEGPKR